MNAPSSTSPGRQATSKQGLVIQLASSLTIVGAVMVAPMLPKIGAEFGAADPHLAEMVPLIATGPALAIALFAPIAGWIADRAGRKNLLIAGTILYALLGFLPAILTSFTAIIVSRLLFGCAEAMIMTTCLALIADYWAGEERVKYINRQVVTIGIVGSVFFVIGGAAGENSWRTPFYLYLLPLLLVPVIATVLWEPERRIDTVDQAKAATVFYSRTEVWRTTLASYLLVFLGMVASFIVPVMAPGLLTAIGVTSTAMIGLATGFGLLATLAGSICWPIARKTLGTSGVNALLLAMVALGLWLLVHAGSYTAVLVAVGVHGFGAGFLVPNASQPLLEKLPPAFRARGAGGFTASLYLGQFASALIIFGIAGSFGGVPVGIGPAIIVWAGVMLAYAALWGGLRLLGSAGKTTAPTK
jgi:MFS family permease